LKLSEELRELIRGEIDRVLEEKDQAPTVRPEAELDKAWVLLDKVTRLMADVTFIEGVETWILFESDGASGAFRLTPGLVATSVVKVWNRRRSALLSDIEKARTSNMSPSHGDPT
jgi:hypothetical protein